MFTTDPIGALGSPTTSASPNAYQPARMVYMTEPKRPGLWDDAEIIHTYSRAEAIADGTLVDVTPTAKQAGFKVPVAITAALRARLEPLQDDKSQGQSFEGRLWDVLNVLRYCATSTKDDTLFFEVIVAENGEQHTVRLKSHIGPGDQAEPVVTIMFEHED